MRIHIYPKRKVRYVNLIHASCHNAVRADGTVGRLFWVKNVFVAQRNRKNVKVFKQAPNTDSFVKSHVFFTHRKISS